jgi:hypothetical protein
VAVTLQRKLELAGDLAKVQPLLQRLHLVKEPKKRFAVRNIILVSSVITALTLVLAAVAVRRRRLLAVAALADDGDYLPADFPTEDALPTEDVLTQQPADF